MERRGPTSSDRIPLPEDSTPGDRIVLALELGRRALALYMAAHPDKSLADARELMMRRNRYGRMPSRVAEGRGR